MLKVHTETWDEGSTTRHRRRLEQHIPTLRTFKSNGELDNLRVTTNARVAELSGVSVQAG